MKGKPRVYVRMLLSYMGRLVIPTAGAVSELEESLCREAGTKLLLPMMLMLGIVMILILVPAYFSFSV